MELTAVDVRAWLAEDFGDGDLTSEAVVPDEATAEAALLLKERGVDTVSRLSAHRRADFRKGTRLGKDDHLVVWRKPTSIRSVDRRTYNALPDAITVREARFRVEQPGFRTRSVVVIGRAPRAVAQSGRPRPRRARPSGRGRHAPAPAGALGLRLGQVRSAPLSGAPPAGAAGEGLGACAT